MEYPSLGLMRTDQVAAKVFDPDYAVADLARWQIHAMEGNQPARHRRPVKLFDEEAVLRHELVAVLAVAHIAVAVRVGVERCEGRRVDRVMQAVGRNLGR